MCRLRRKNDYYNSMNDGTNGHIQSSNPSLLMATSGIYSGCDMDHLTSTSHKDRMAECSFKRTSSSNDSHSVEQMDSAFQSDLKTKDEIVQQQCASHVSVFTSFYICYLSSYCTLLGCIWLLIS